MTFTLCSLRSFAANISAYIVVRSAGRIVSFWTHDRLFQSACLAPSVILVTAAAPDFIAIPENDEHESG